MPGAGSQGLDASFYPNPFSRLQDTTNLLGLNLPPNTLRIIAQCQAAGRLPAALLNTLQQPQQPAPGAAKQFVTAKTRSTARAHSQPNLRRPRAPSAYARGVIAKVIAKPVPQPHEAAGYMPPPMKSRTRRAAKSKAKAPSPPVAAGPSNPIPSAGAAQAAASQGEATPDTASQSVNGYSAVARAITEQPGLKNFPTSLIMRVLPGLVDKYGESWEAGVAPPSGSGTSDSMAYSESPSPPVMGVPTMDVAGSLPMSSPSTAQSEGSPLVEQPEFVPGDDTGDSMGFSAAFPTQFPDWYSTMNTFPEWGMPALPSVEAPTYEPEQPSATSLTEELNAILQGGQSNVVAGVNEQNAGEDHSAALQCILDLLAGEGARSDTGLAPPTREDFEGPLSALPNKSAEPGRDVGEVGTEEIGQFVDDFLNDNWEGFIDFDGAEKV
jgi:hypothetical protein